MKNLCVWVSSAGLFFGGALHSNLLIAEETSKDGACAVMTAALAEDADQRPKLQGKEKNIASKMGIQALWISPKMEVLAAKLGIHRPSLSNAPGFSRIAESEKVLDGFFFPFLEAILKPENAETRAKLSNWLERVERRYQAALKSQGLEESERLFIQALENETLDIPELEKKKDEILSIPTPLKKASEGPHVLKVDFLSGESQPPDSTNPWEKLTVDSEKIKHHLEVAQGSLLEKIQKLKRTSSGNLAAVQAAAKDVMVVQMELAVLLFGYLDSARGDQELQEVILGELRTPGLFDLGVINMILEISKGSASAGNSNSTFLLIRQAWYQPVLKIYNFLKDRGSDLASGASGE